MPEIPHPSCAASMILPFSQASGRSSPGISLFLVAGRVWLGACDGETESFQGHYPETDADASQQHEAGVREDADASASDATPSDLPLADIGTVFRSCSLVGTSASGAFFSLAAFRGELSIGQFGDSSEPQTIPGQSYVAYLQDLGGPLYLAKPRGSKTDSGPCSLRVSPEGDQDWRPVAARNTVAAARRRAGTPQLPPAA